MLKRYVFEREDRLGAAWTARFAAGREAAARWYQGEGRGAPASAAECRTALGQHMPELLSHYDEACALVGDDDLARRILSHWRPPPLATGCTQAVWLGPEGPALVRNQDFPLDLITERFELTSWSGRKVIAKGQRPWGGCLDGINEDGLVACANFGGSTSQGEGFSIILMLRHVLETCRRVEEAVAALCRIPIALSQNVVLLDGTGDFATLFLGPDRTPAVTRGLEPNGGAAAGGAGSVGRSRHHVGGPDGVLPRVASLFQSCHVHHRIHSRIPAGRATRRLHLARPHHHTAHRPLRASRVRARFRQADCVSRVGSFGGIDYSRVLAMI